MHYVYLLKSERDDKLYVGCTNNLRKRLLMHNSGKIDSTRFRKPFKLIFYEAFTNKRDAFAREKWLKTGWGRNHIKKILNNYLNTRNLGG